MKSKHFKDTTLIATRANRAVNANDFDFVFFKSYVKKAKVVRRQQTGVGYTEMDFTFEYKGKPFLLTNKIKGNNYSAAGTYKLFELKEVERIGD